MFFEEKDKFEEAVSGAILRGLTNQYFSPRRYTSSIRGRNSILALYTSKGDFRIIRNPGNPFRSNVRISVEVQLRIKNVQMLQRDSCNLLQSTLPIVRYLVGQKWRFVCALRLQTETNDNLVRRIGYNKKFSESCLVLHVDT